jgi:hypothetical protein
VLNSDDLWQFDKVIFKKEIGRFLLREDSLGEAKGHSMKKKFYIILRFLDQHNFFYRI